MNFIRDLILFFNFGCLTIILWLKADLMPTHQIGHYYIFSYVTFAFTMHFMFKAIPLSSALIPEESSTDIEKLEKGGEELFVNDSSETKESSLE